MPTKPLDVALAFVAAVNAASPGRLEGLMTEDHVFIDSDGARCRGRREMIMAWRDYFAMVPDYRIVVRDSCWTGDSVLLAGEAEGTFGQGGLLKPENHWRVPAAWRAIIDGERVAAWQVYVNPEPMAGILRRLRGS
jgi:ketosteroid isomerase-like protein